MMQNFVSLRTGRPGKMAPPVENYVESLDPALSGMLRNVMQCSAFGAQDDVARGMADFIARTQVDELIVHSPAFDPQARLHSVALIAKAFESLNVPA